MLWIGGEVMQYFVDDVLWNRGDSGDDFCWGSRGGNHPGSCRGRTPCFRGFRSHSGSKLRGE